MTAADVATELAEAMRAFLAAHLDRLQRAGGEPAAALPVVRGLLAGLDDDLRDGLDAADRTAGIRAGPPDGLPGEAEVAAFLAGDPAVRAAWASRAVRQTRASLLLALAGLEHALVTRGPASARRVAGSEIRLRHGTEQLVAALDAWEDAVRRCAGDAPRERPRAVPGERLLAAREALAAGEPTRAARLAIAALDALPASPRAAALRRALAEGEAAIVAPALLDGVETVLREA